MLCLGSTILHVQPVKRLSVQHVVTLFWDVLGKRLAVGT